MGTTFSFDIREPGVPTEALERAIALLHDIDGTFSTYQATSEVSRLAAGQLCPGAASPQVRSVLEDCEQWQERTEGWFSPYAGGQLDPSGYVKGWAIRRVSDLLAESGSVNHCVNGGGDLQCAGSASPATGWRSGIVDPRDHRTVLSTVSGTGIAVASSGTAERGAHVLDPHTGLPPADPLLQLSVAGRDVLECDVYATAGFAMGRAARDWFAGRDEVRVFGVELDGSTFSTFQR